MRTQRTKALLAAVGAFLLAAVGVLLAPGAASAAPDYPPPPADLALSSGTVRAGNSVGVYGQGFGAKEPVIIVVKVRPRSGYWFPRQGFVTHKHKVWTNRDGEFKTRVPTYVAGTATSRPTTGSGRSPDTDRAPDASRGAPGEPHLLHLLCSLNQSSRAPLPTVEQHHPRNEDERRTKNEELEIGTARHATSPFVSLLRVRRLSIRPRRLDAQPR